MMNRRAVTAVGAAVVLAMTGCGRSTDSGGGASATASEVSSGAATGTLSMWAMGRRVTSCRHW